MNLRLANLNDLFKLRAVYENIIDNMNRNNIPIWDEIYPCEFSARTLKIIAFICWLRKMII